VQPLLSQDDVCTVAAAVVAELHVKQVDTL